MHLVCRGTAFDLEVRVFRINVNSGKMSIVILFSIQPETYFFKELTSSPCAWSAIFNYWRATSTDSIGAAEAHASKKLCS